MNKPKRSDDKYWKGTRDFDHIQYETDLEDYISEIEVVGQSTCADCANGRDEFEPDWKCPECRRLDEEK